MVRPTATSSSMTRTRPLREGLTLGPARSLATDSSATWRSAGVLCSAGASNFLTPCMFDSRSYSTRDCNASPRTKSLVPEMSEDGFFDFRFARIRVVLQVFAANCHHRCDTGGNTPTCHRPGHDCGKWATHCAMHTQRRWQIHDLARQTAGPLASPLDPRRDAQRLVDAGASLEQGAGHIDESPTLEGRTCRQV